MKKLYYENVRKYSTNNIFFLTIFLCVIINFFFLRVVLKNGLTGDDWDLLFAYKTFPQPLNRILDAWMIRGPYTTIQFYYIGILEGFFGLNYQLFQIINICFKIFASITLFLLISKIFKDYFLASLSAVIFSIIHSSAGALAYVVKGTEYLAMGFMNLFFLFYYYAVIKNSKIISLFAAIILFITFMLSPIRMYPLYSLILIIEILLFIKIKRISYLLLSFFRLILFYGPPFLLGITRIGSSSIDLNGTINYIGAIKKGEWQYLLLPFKALGYTVLGNDQLELLYSPPYLIGILFMLCSVFYFVIWIKNGRKLGKFFLLFFGPWFAFFFIISTIAYLGTAYNILSSLHWYLIVPSIGVSVFFSALIGLSFELGIKLKKPVYQFVTVIIFVAVALISYFEINKHFDYLLSIGTGAKDQVYMQNQILNSIDKQYQLNLILYLEQSKEPQEQSNTQFYAVALNTGYFGHWFQYFKKPQFLGCTTVVTDKAQLREFYKVKEREYFEADGFCAETRYDIKTAMTVYNISDFRAFLLKDKKAFNITNQILEDLRSKNI